MVPRFKATAIHRGTKMRQTLKKRAAEWWEEGTAEQSDFRYDLNQITYDYTVEVTKRFKEISKTA